MKPPQTHSPSLACGAPHRLTDPWHPAISSRSLGASSSGRKACSAAPGSPITGLLELGDAKYAAAVDRWLDNPGDDTRQVLDAEAPRAATRQAALLRQIARRADFQEAVTWQNPDVVEPMIVTLGQMSSDAPNNHRLRKRQRIVARYWARYCAKTETTGFFGSVSWLDLRADGAPLRMEPGSGSISSEPKPVFVDFRSEVQVGNLAQLLRTGAETEGASVTFSEMMPAPGQSWLADAAGNHYTSELRLVFVDGHHS